MLGGDYDGQAIPPEGEFETIDAGSGHTCGLRPDQTVECWGVDDFGETDAPDGRFTAIAAGQGYSCALRLDGSIDKPEVSSS